MAVFFHEQLYVVLLDLVAGRLLNARVRYLRFAFTTKSVTSLRRFYAMMFVFFLLIWSIAEYNSPLPRVCIDRKKSVTSHMT